MPCYASYNLVSFSLEVAQELLRSPAIILCYEVS